MTVPTKQDAQSEVVLRAARSIFEWRLPSTTWSDPLFQDYRDDCLALAVQHRQMFLAGVQIEPVHLWETPSGNGISREWQIAFVKSKLAEALTMLAVGVPITSLDAADRCWIKAQAEQMVDDAVDHFNAPVKDDGSNYQPQDEPEYHQEGGR